MEMIEEAVGRHSVPCKFKCISDGFIWAFSGVYGPQMEGDKRCLCEELAGVIHWWEIPWCLGGEPDQISY